mmetsp:Transcript_1695/g.6530  ORF Transcript_1695/g.6530 Transcript_1695/m.6530 type:complete len:307 (+) Transcript_1695:1664-2584(+)
MLAQCAVALVSDTVEGLVRRFVVPVGRALPACAADATLRTDVVVLSVVVPARNESLTVGATIVALLERAERPDLLELILVDGGSTDATVDVARRAAQSRGSVPRAMQVVASQGGRGAALRAGTDVASGGLVLFVHADVLVPRGYDRLVRDGLASRTGDTAGTTRPLLCAFRLAFARETTDDADRWVLGLVERAANFRARRLALPWGDQGLAARRADLADALDHGFDAALPILEDLDLVVRARRAAARLGRPAVRTLDACVEASPRRYRRRGLLASNWINAGLLLWWHLGATPHLIFRLYYGHDVSA